MSGNPTTTPPSNVVPMPTNWPGPMFMPKSWPQPPSCFSELASLNACYDSIQMMNQILAKVITDLVTNDKAVQTAIVEAIAASGSNVPLIGVTNGQDAQPGQVGEFIAFNTPFNIATGTNVQQVTSGVVQPGDWDLWSEAGVGGPVQVIYFQLSPQPAGFSASLGGYAENAAGITASVVGLQTRALISVPSLLTFSMSTTASAAVANNNFNVYGRRRR